MSNRPTLDDLLVLLEQQACVADRDAVTTPRQRAINVTRRARTAHRRRTGAMAGLAVATTAAVAAVALQAGLPDSAGDRGSAPAVSTPGPRLRGSGGVHTGYRYPSALKVSGRTYEYGQAYDAAAGSRWIRIEADASGTRRALAWSTSSDTRGTVSVAVDGVVISRSTAGALESGAALSPGHPHTVTIRANGIRGHERLALVVYDQAAR